jgi:hypothetical protein
MVGFLDVSFISLRTNSGLNGQTRHASEDLLYQALSLGRDYAVFGEVVDVVTNSPGLAREQTGL